MIHYITTSGIGNAWVANELGFVQKAGIPFALHAMRKTGGGYHISDWAQRIGEETRVIYPLPVAGLLLSILAAPFLFRGRFFAALGNALFGRRESFRARVAAFAHLFVACHWARLIRRDEVDHIHSQWIHSAGTIGFYGAWLLGASFSFTGHATDLFRDRVALEDKIRRSRFIICISNFHRELYLSLGAREEQLTIVYCGIDPEVFTPKPVEMLPDGPLRLRASGRLVDKKGFADLIEACRILGDRGVPVECVIGGSGPLLDSLEAKVAESGLTKVVTLTGQELKQEKIPEFMYGADVYCLPCCWAPDGDVDGLPQMLMEAMACGLPVVSTRLVGIPDLVSHEESGLLVAPNAPEELADAIQRFRDEPDLGPRLVEGGHRILSSRFDIRDCLEPLFARFREVLESRKEDGRAS